MRREGRSHALLLMGLMAGLAVLATLGACRATATAAPEVNQTEDAQTDDADAPRPLETEDPMTIDARGSATICDLHGVALRDDIVRIVHGLPDPAPRYDEAERRLFPNARTSLFSGTCMVAPPYFAKVKCCPTCRRVRKLFMNPEQG